MNRLSKKIENIFLAITFAEAGEADPARKFLSGEDRPGEFQRTVSRVRPEKELRSPGAGKR